MPASFALEFAFPASAYEFFDAFASHVSSYSFLPLRPVLREGLS